MGGGLIGECEVNSRGEGEGVGFLREKGYHGIVAKDSE